MAKEPTLNTITTGYFSTPALTENFDNIYAAFTNTLSLDGSTPNSMNADLDLNGFDILNAGGLTIGGVDVFTLVNSLTVSTSNPSGGSSGDVWIKVSS
jgi:hypothetical protein